MKREGTILDQDEPDKKKSAVSVVGLGASDTNELATRFNLTDLAHELLIQICSCLNVKERNISRRVCRQLAELVDQCTPGAEELVVNSTTRSNSVSTNPLFPEKVYLNLEPPRGRGYTLSVLRSSIPLLRNIRPNKLCLNSGMGAVIMSFLVEQQVARSVSSIHLEGWMDPLGPAAQVRRVCALFDRASQNGVKSLELLRCRPEIVLPLAVYFPRLNRLKFDMTAIYFGDAETVHFHLLPLRNHSTLREICISGSPQGGADFVLRVNTRLMTSLASIVNLRKLTFEINFYDMMNEDEEEVQIAELVRVFGNMLRGLTNLQSLSLQFVRPNLFWNSLAEEESVRSSSVQELSIVNRENKSAGEEVRAMVSSLIKVFPSLIALEVGSASLDLDWETKAALSGLAHHPSLKRLEYCRGPAGQAEEEEETFLKNLQAAFGTKIRLVHVLN